MRSLSGIFFTGLILVNLFGFYIMFICMGAGIKEEMAEKIACNSSKTSQQILSFSKEAFSKLLFNDNGKEFALDGKLYDVVSIEHSGSVVKVTVEFDSKETDLVEGFTSLFSQQQGKDQSSSPVKNLISHFQQNYVISHANILCVNYNSFVAFYGANQLFPISSFIADRLAPPPQYFLV